MKDHMLFLPSRSGKTECLKLADGQPATQVRLHCSVECITFVFHAHQLLVWPLIVQQSHEAPTTAVSNLSI